MRLIKCNIENYGTLSNFELRFDEQLTVINEENGFGKSTLCSFIMAMFYGLPSTTKRKVEENERKLRAPWQGGNFGGTLDFEINGKEYRIERFFGQKANSDTFRLFDLKKGTESRDYSENIGAEIFSIDAEGFRRSIFFPQLDSVTSANVSITAKLMDLIENSDDMSNFDNAMGVLKKRKNDYSNARGKGFLSEIETNIAATEQTLSDAIAATESISELSKQVKVLESKAETLQSERSNINNLLQKAAEQAAVKSDKKRREELTAEIEGFKLEIEAINRQFPKGLPEKSVLNEAFGKAEALKAAESEYKMLSNDGVDLAELDRLNNLFKDSSVDEVKIETVRSKAAQLSSLKARCEAKYEMLTAQPVENTRCSRLAMPFLLICASVSAVAGCAMLFSSVAVAIVLLVAGLILFGSAAFLYLKNMIDRGESKTDLSVVKSEYEALKNDVDSMTAELEAFFAHFGLDGTFQEQAYRLSADLVFYRTLKERVKKSEAKRSELSNKKEALKVELDELLNAFEIPVQNGDYSATLLNMRDSKLSYDRVTELWKAAEKRMAEIPEVVVEEGCEELDREVLKQRDAELKVALDELSGNIIGFKNRIGSLRPKADEVPYLENDLASLKEQFKERSAELFTIEKAMEFLETARENLSSRYRQPLSDGFKKYADIMLSSNVGEFLLDAEFNLSLERFGKAFEKDYFSAGYKDLLDIATRFALCDALYKDEKPPVILDDPFVNLDEGKLKNALSLLEKLSEDRQIVYLTCHRSRVPE